jgi:hypothetical protein
MAIISRLASKAVKKPPFKSVRETVAEKAAARKDASTFKTVAQLKKEAVEAKPSMRKAVEPADKSKKARTEALKATNAALLGTSMLVYSQVPPECLRRAHPQQKLKVAVVVALAQPTLQGKTQPLK